MKSNLNYFVKIKFKVHKTPASNVIEFFKEPNSIFISMAYINQNVNENPVYRIGTCIDCANLTKKRDFGF